MSQGKTVSGLAGVAAATAVVLADGRRAGSGVLVDADRLLTAGHVLGRAGAVLPARIEVVFPFGSGGQPGAGFAARPVSLGAAAAGADVAVLDLCEGTGPGGALPAPVVLSPARRLPSRVSVFGYPLGEKALNGVWRDFQVAGPAADGTVQLDWADSVGSWAGHSGGPVIDPDTGALAGILVQGSERGRFDRFVPLAVITGCCPGLPRPWLMAGADARRHFISRSRGQRGSSQGGDLFRGRQAALGAVQGWLTVPAWQG